MLIQHAIKYRDPPLFRLWWWSFDVHMAMCLSNFQPVSLNQYRHAFKYVANRPMRTVLEVVIEVAARCSWLEPPEVLPVVVATLWIWDYVIGPGHCQF